MFGFYFSQREKTSIDLELNIIYLNKLIRHSVGSALFNLIESQLDLQKKGVGKLVFDFPVQENYYQFVYTLHIGDILE